ncbi:MAG: ABC transporter ATP-binding protein [Victivallales bacterium]|nr:ABC transporter ATP-binding protein [Victivallales bacterium]
MSDKKSILKADSVEFSYSRGMPTLSGFDIVFEEGCMTGLIGPNGAGKSTALKILSGYICPDSGRVLVKGSDIRDMTHSQRARTMAVVAQNVFSPLPFTARQVVEMGRTLRISRFSPLGHEDIAAVDDAMEEMDVLRLSQKKFNELSGGEKQLVRMAAALAQEPEIMLLDEPTSQLDIGHGLHLMNHLKRLNSKKGLSIVLVSHDIQLISTFMKTFVLMKNGGIISRGGAGEVITAENIKDAYSCNVEVLNIRGAVHIITDSR